MNRSHLFIQPPDCGYFEFSEWLLISNGEFPSLHSLRNPIPGELKIHIKLSPRKCQKSRLKKPNMNYNDISWWETSQFRSGSQVSTNSSCNLFFFFSEGHLPQLSSRAGGSDHSCISETSGANMMDKGGVSWSTSRINMLAQHCAGGLIKMAKSWQRTKVVATMFLFPPSQLWKWISQQSHHFWMSIPRSIFQSSKTSSTLSCYISLISQQISQSFCMSSWCSQHGRSFSLGREAIDVLSSLQC